MGRREAAAAATWTRHISRVSSSAGSSVGQAAAAAAVAVGATFDMTGTFLLPASCCHLTAGLSDSIYQEKRDRKRQQKIGSKMADGRERAATDSSDKEDS